MINFNEEVLRIDGETGNFTIKTNKKNYISKTVIIASGGGLFSPIKLGIKNEDSFINIHYSVKQSSDFIGKKLLIFGGGDSAIDWAYFFHKKGSTVKLIHRRDKFRGQEHLLQKMKDKISILTPYKIKEVYGKNKIERVILVNVKTQKTLNIDCDDLLVFFGQKKLSAKDDKFNIDNNEKGYFVKSNMETSRKSIFAIGNVSNYKGKIKMMVTGLGEAATAVGSVVEICKPGKKMSYFIKKKER